MTLLFDQSKVIEAINAVDARTLADLRTEVATKADLAALKTDLAHLEARMESRLGMMDSRLARLETMVKLLIGLAVVAIGMFSPVASKLFTFIK